MRGLGFTSWGMWGWNRADPGTGVKQGSAIQRSFLLPPVLLWAEPSSPELSIASRAGTDVDPQEMKEEGLWDGERTEGNCFPEGSGKEPQPPAPCGRIHQGPKVMPRCANLGRDWNRQFLSQCCFSFSVYFIKKKWCTLVGIKTYMSETKSKFSFFFLSLWILLTLTHACQWGERWPVIMVPFRTFFMHIQIIEYLDTHT